VSPNAPDLFAALTVEQLLASVAIRIDGPRAWDEHFVISFALTDLDAVHVVEVRNGTLVQRCVSEPAEGSTTFSLTRALFGALLGGALDLVEAIGDGRVVVNGDPAVFGRLARLLDPPDPDFSIVTP
jgi:alkyl sulfatase BDS1-like metallo-beta-lactamase superfamily hydrolase